MRPANFEYHRAHTVAEARGLLESCGEGAKVLAGGLSLVPTMRLRLAEPEHIIDISHIPNLSYVVENDSGGISIGALTNYQTLAASKLVKSKHPMLNEVASIIGDPQVRNRGTIGGNLCHADPASDVSPVLLALNTELVIAGPKGNRTIKAEDFFVDLFTTPLEHAELLAEIRIPPSIPHTGSSYMKLNQRRGDYAFASAAVAITLEKKSVCKAVQIGLGSVAPIPMRALRTEKALLGKTLTEDLIEKAANLAAHKTDPPSDVHATAAYRKEMVKVMTKRALQESIKRVR